MKSDEYLMKQITLGYHVPEGIHPYRYGRVDTESVKDKSVIIKGLLATGDFCVVKEGYGVKSNFFSARLGCSILGCKSMFGSHFENVSKRAFNCINIVDAENTNYFHQEMLNNDLTRYPLYEMDSILDKPVVFKKIIREENPNVVVINLAHSAKCNKTLSVIGSWVQECRRYGIAFVLVVREQQTFPSDFPEIDHAITIRIIDGNCHTYIIEETTEGREPTFEAFKIVSENGNWKSVDVEPEELDAIDDRVKPQSKPEVDPNLDLGI